MKFRVRIEGITDDGVILADELNMESEDVLKLEGEARKYYQDKNHDET